MTTSASCVSSSKEGQLRSRYGWLYLSYAVCIASASVALADQASSVEETSLAPGGSDEVDDDGEDSLINNFTLDYHVCSAHLQRLDWNRNVSDQVWNTNYVRTKLCLQHSSDLAKMAGKSRSAAMTGIHVPTVIAPAVIEDLPALPPFYYVLPLWDMVVSNMVRLFGSYDIQELDVLVRLTRAGDTFVDIGANVGAVAVPVAAHVGEEGAVYAFEPFRQVFQYLNANVAVNGLSNVHTFHCGLSDPTNAPREVQVPAPSLKAGQNAGMYAVFQGASANVNERTSQTRETLEMVSIRTLDSFSLPKADVMKIDVEGHASRVLAGGAETIRKHRPIIWFEENDEAPEFLRELGIGCTKMMVTTEDQFLCVPQERFVEIHQRLAEG